MPWKKKHVAGSKIASNAELRECFRRKLQFAVDRIGSVNRASAIIGVNRTQFSRYLAGQSMPRPDMLYRLSQSLSLPMEWFFDTEPDDAKTLAEHQFGGMIRDELREHQFRIDNQEFPDGFYVLWKRTFATNFAYEKLICQATTMNGVKRLKISSQWRRPDTIDLPKLTGSQRFYNCLMQRSANGLHLISHYGPENRTITMYMRGAASGWFSDSRMMFTGIAIAGAFGNFGGRVMVPVMFTHLKDATLAEILPIARVCGAYNSDEVASGVRDTLDRVGVPEFNILV